MMQLTINISNDSLSEKILWLLNSFKKDGLEVIVHKEKNVLKKLDDSLDFSSFKVESFKNIDGLAYQKSVRDESIKGIFNQYADITKQEQEKDAWKNSVVSKY